MAEDKQSKPSETPEATKKSSLFNKFLNLIERSGNKLPDPAILFFFLMIFIWIISAVLSPLSFSEIDPRTGEQLIVYNQLTGDSLAAFLAGMIETFVLFAPLGIVLVAMLGVGVAEHSGWIDAGLKKLLNFTPATFLTPMLILIAIISHTAADAGYVLVIPLGGVIFYAAGRHPLAGIAAAFAGVSGGFSANFIPSAIDPMLASITLEAARIFDPEIVLNPINNWYFTSASSVLIVLVGWYITDRIVEPRLKGLDIDGDEDQIPQMVPITDRESRAFWYGFIAMVLGLVGLFLWALPEGSGLRDPNWDNPEVSSLFSPNASLMQAIVPLIFVLMLIPGVVYGFASGKYSSSRDMIQNMTKSMESMGYYIVMAFFCALFIDAFNQSNVGLLIAVKGANFLEALSLPGQVTIVGIIILSAFVNLFIGSASAKWLLVSPIFVPMLMQLGISPDLTQAAYRVGDSVSNILTPLLPYFPLVVVFCQRYVKSTGIGTVISMMVPYTIIFLIAWTIFLIIYWALGIPLSFEAHYVYPAN